MLKSLASLISSLLSPDKSDNIKGQAVRQILSGFLATITDLAVFQVCLKLDIKVLAAALIAQTFSAVVNFIITKFYVFGHVDRQKKKSRVQFILYIFTVLVSIGLTQLFLLIFSLWLGFEPMLVKIISVPFIFIWTLFCGKYIVFDKYLSFKN
jgi:putative flippase GtrA